MKATELRIGNWIYVDGKPIDIASNVISEYHWSELTTTPTTYSPIPLTEEWLKKFGFKQWQSHVSINVGSENRIYWQIGKERNLFWESYDNTFTLDRVNKEDSPRVKYVHQLQNLYHALTNQELEIHNSIQKERQSN